MFLIYYCNNCPQNVYEDVMDIISKLPLIVSSIYRWNLKGDKLFIPQMDPTKDWTANLCCMLGFDYPEFMDFMRLFMALFRYNFNIISYCIIMISTLSLYLFRL